MGDERHRIDANLTIELAPGHTPGLGVIKLDSKGDRAVFVGDLLHSPVQILGPDWNSCFCEDPAEARRSRRSVLGGRRTTTRWLIPAHLGGNHAAEVVRDGDKFAIKRWAPFRAS